MLSQHLVSSPKALRKWFGNILILASVILLGFIYWPIAKLYIPGLESQELYTNNAFSISIPKINANAPIIADVPPWDEKQYTNALEKGVAHAQGFAKPGEQKTGPIFLFAHSSDAAWRVTRYNVVFFRLGELTTGDLIKIRHNGLEYRYIVFDKKEVWPNDVAALTKQGGVDLIVQTCTPIGTSLKRLLVFAKQQEP